MYLNDEHIKGCLDKLAIETSEDGKNFNPDIQIQPCSIDLRLSNIFWRPKKREYIDLRQLKNLPVDSEEQYERLTKKETEYIELKHGELLFARTYENFTIPDSCAGQIIARSSIARKGLMIHCASGFINPGWKGNMPLQLVNLNPNTFQIFPYVSICQLCLIKLTDVPSRKYNNVNNDFMNDYGAPFITPS